MVSEEKKIQIGKEARSILDKFAGALDQIDLEGKKDLKKGLGGFREEKGEGEKCDSEFKERMFENAPKKEGDFILAEKKKW